MAPLRLLLLFLSVFFSVCNVKAEEPGWAHYRTLLAHVERGQKNGVSLMQVDYQTVKSNGSLESAYQALIQFNPDFLSGQKEKLAFYINAYNILALKMIADHWPLESIKDLGNFFSPVWNKRAGTLGGNPVTLGGVEHKILRPMGDPRIHFAIVCASVSCPDLRSEPYLAGKIDVQLDDQVRQFLNNPGKGLRIGEKTIHVSRIFDWFEEDFDATGGVATFVKRYRSQLPELKVSADIPYDWAVNGLD